MSPTLNDYWERQVAALRKRSVSPEPKVDRTEAVVLYDVRDPYRGTIDARVWFDDDAFLDVFEHVAIDENGVPSRSQYSYHFQVGSETVERHDYDPDLNNPEDRHHMNVIHQGRRLHITSERITLVQLVEQCWGVLSDIRETEE